MKIVHVSEYTSGGVATYLRNTVAFQLNSNQVSNVILFNAKQGSEDFNFSSRKFTHRIYDYSRKASGLLTLFELRKEIDKLNPDIVHFHSSFAGVIRLTYYLKPASYKVVYCAHGWSFIQRSKGKFINKVYELVERMAAKKTDLIINISDSEELIAKKHKLPSQKMRIVYNSIPDNKQLVRVKNPFQSNRGRKLLFIGRFDKAKGLEFLLNNGEFQKYNLELVVIGESILHDTWISDHSEGNVTFLGWVNNAEISAYIDLCDAVIIPSLWEGFGLVGLEAMRRHKMVLSSDAGGLSELILNEKNGLVFRAGSREELNLVLKEFSEMSQKSILSMGECGFDYFKEKYNFEKLENKLLDYYLI